MARDNFPSFTESVEFFEKNAGAIMSLGDDLVQSSDGRTAGVGKVLLALLCHGMTLAHGQEQAVAAICHLVGEVPRPRIRQGRIAH